MKDTTRAQIAAARGLGCSVGGYVFCKRNQDPTGTVRDALELARSSGAKIPVLWLDIEQNPFDNNSIPGEEWIEAAVAECRVQGARPGIYSGLGPWPKIGNPTRFSAAGVPVWVANFNNDPTLDVPLFGGWDSASAHQWTDKDPDGNGLDRDVFLAELCQ